MLEMKWIEWLCHRINLPPKIPRIQQRINPWYNFKIQLCPLFKKTHCFLNLTYYRSFFMASNLHTLFIPQLNHLWIQCLQTLQGCYLHNVSRCLETSLGLLTWSMAKQSSRWLNFETEIEKPAAIVSYYPGGLSSTKNELRKQHNKKKQMDMKRTWLELWRFK